MGQKQLYGYALALAVFTVVYNIIEGVIAIYFGIEDETLSLLGFGIDSFVEVISGIGIWHMVLRIRRHESESPDRFEKTALRITAIAFYLLTAGLLATALINIINGHQPVTTLWGTIISLVSISFMWLLIHYKVKVGTALGSQAIIADAHCSRACLHFSLVLLVASLGYQFTGIGYIDAIGAVIIAWLAYKEGREAWSKAHGLASCGCSDTCQTD
ncbi:MAG: cation transporter [Gammaproteobacteria bacterium]|nr:cation transporter [Gammaproteobacteria bacterium]